MATSVPLNGLLGNISRLVSDPGFLAALQARKQQQQAQMTPDQLAAQDEANRLAQVAMSSGFDIGIGVPSTPEQWNIYNQYQAAVARAYGQPGQGTIATSPAPVGSRPVPVETRQPVIPRTLPTPVASTLPTPATAANPPAGSVSLNNLLTPPTSYESWSQQYSPTGKGVSYEQMQADNPGLSQNLIDLYSTQRRNVYNQQLINKGVVPANEYGEANPNPGMDNPYFARAVAEGYDPNVLAQQLGLTLTPDQIKEVQDQANLQKLIADSNQTGDPVGSPAQMQRLFGSSQQWMPGTPLPNQQAATPATPAQPQTNIAASGTTLPGGFTRTQPAQTTQPVQPVQSPMGTVGRAIQPSPALQNLLNMRQRATIPSTNQPQPNIGYRPVEMGRPVPTQQPANTGISAPPPGTTYNQFRSNIQQRQIQPVVPQVNSF